MTQSNDRYEKLLVIGNGFDLNAQLKTSYKDFLQFLHRHPIADKPNPLLHYMRCLILKGCQPTPLGDNWVDLEHQLKAYVDVLSSDGEDSFNPTGMANQMWEYTVRNFPDDFNYSRENTKDQQAAWDRINLKKSLSNQLENNYKELVAKLCEYLKQQQENDPPQESIANLLLKSGGNLFNSTSNGTFSHIFSLNYTNTVQRIGSDAEVFHIHGTIENNDIVFGVEDNKVPEQYIFLTKAAQHAFGQTPSLSQAILNAEEVHFFGCSFGDTDIAHFEEAFKGLCNQTSSTRKKIFFYVHNKNSYLGILKRIMDITGKLSQFKAYNDVKFLDTQSQYRESVIGNGNTLLKEFKLHEH